MRKGFASNPANASRTESDAPLYCSVLSITTPTKIICSVKKAVRCKPGSLLSPGFNQKHFRKYSRDKRSVINQVTSHSSFPIYHYRLNPLLTLILLLYETPAAEKIRNVDIINDVCEFDFCERCIWPAYADKRPR